MYLQSLEIIGFKSFAPKTILNFHRGVTAIVGPNGCGKSNVLDAIRWVLGEQSAKALRGGEMADVIFSGTDSRAALGMAEVSMTFSECEQQLGVEWNEVRITRRVFRDGRSEYFMNKTPCRLRDIHQLFMDTGVGRGAYSIMEQGRIDQILSSRPEDRRAIFEEAAGITKYKSQKKEALRKLEYTEGNLLRVQDIIKEVKRQIGSLQRQAAKARRYQALMQDLRTFDTHLSFNTYSQLSTELENLRSELGRGDEARGIHETEIAQQEIELTGFRVRMEELDREVSRLRDSAQTVRNRIFSAESRIVTNSERSEESRTLIDRHRTDIAAAEEKTRVQQTQIEEADDLLSKMIETLQTQEESLTVQNERVNTVRQQRITAETNLRQIGEEIARLDARLGSLRGEISAAAGRRESGETRLRLLQGESEASQRVAEDITARAEDVVRRAQAAEIGLQEALTEQAAAVQGHEVSQKARQDSEYALNTVSKDAATIESRLEILRQLQEEGEGFDEGTQSILRGLDNPEFFKPAVVGALANGIQVESQFIPAIEAALGGALQAIVFKDAGMAEAALKTLSGKKLGKASIVPREWIAARGEANNLQLPEEALLWAKTCVTSESEGGDLVSALLVDVAVVENLETAFRLKSLHPTLAFATLAGEFLSREGIVRGGQSGENTGQSALVRKAQIADLDRELASAIERLEANTAQRMRALEAFDAAQNRLLQSRQSVQAAQIEQASLKNEHDLLSRQQADIEARRGAFSRETTQIEESLRSSIESINRLETNITEITQALDSFRSQRAESEQLIQSVREHESEAVEALNEIRVRVATERQQQDNLSRQRAPMTARIAELGELMDARRTDITTYENRIQALERENTELGESIEEWRQEGAKIDEEGQTFLAQRGETQESAEAVEIALRAARQQLVQLQEQKGRLEVRSAQIEMRRENLRTHVSQRYQTDLEAFSPDSYALMCAFRDRDKKKTDTPTEEVMPESGEVVVEAPEEIAEAIVEAISESELESSFPQEEGIPWERIEEIVAELTERLDSMGPVNLEAIQEYEELEQRYIFLEQQNADLTTAKAELLDVISKINKTTRELFAETFEKIRINFQEMFTELFGGGRANLLLVDESDPLESGIEIIAKPPGKQLQSISLLSGGERTMTAVSLLFSIYMVKPSPFCVLDEMDAPLDESNINRFIKILDRFVDQSQFVVITHNKRTIGRADMLYGVTMQEHGVSKLVSVKFTSKEEVAAAEKEKSIAESFGKSGDLHSEQQMAEK